MAFYLLYFPVLFPSPNVVKSQFFIFSLLDIFNPLSLVVKATFLKTKGSFSHSTAWESEIIYLLGAACVRVYDHEIWRNDWSVLKYQINHLPLSSSQPLVWNGDAKLTCMVRIWQVYNEQWVTEGRCLHWVLLLGADPFCASLFRETDFLLGQRRSRCFRNRLVI